MLFKYSMILRIGIIVLILIIAAYLRVWNLGGKFSYDYDEGVYAMSARMILKGYKPFKEVFSSQPSFHLYGIALFLLIFGMNIVAARLFSVFLSLVGILATYLLTSYLEDEKAGIIAAIFLAITPYFLYYSRAVEAEVPCISLAILAFYMAFKAIESSNRNVLYSLFSGVVFGMAISTKLLAVYTALPILLLFLIKRKFKFLSIFIGGAMIVPAIIALSLGPREVIAQAIIMHLNKPPTGTFESRLALLVKFLSRDSGLAILSLIGTLFSIITDIANREFKRTLLVIWHYATIISLLNYKALFIHHYVILMPTFAMLASLSLVTPFNFMIRTCSIYSEYIIRALALASIPCLFLASVYVYHLPEVINYDMYLLKYKDIEYYEAIASFIKEHTSPNDFIITDQQALAFLADRNVPPNLVDTSHMRISSGFLTSEMMISLTKKYNVKMVIFWTGRLIRLREFVNYVKANFKLIKSYGSGREIYIS